MHMKVLQLFDSLNVKILDYFIFSEIFTDVLLIKHLHVGPLNTCIQWHTDTIPLKMMYKMHTGECQEQWNGMPVSPQF